MSVWAGLTPPYATIVADPPWQGYTSPTCKGAPERHYSTMPLTDIRTFRRVREHLIEPST